MTDSIDLSEEVVAALANGRYADPFAVLGPHAASRDGQTGFVIRVIRPNADSVSLVPGDGIGSAVPLAEIHTSGLFQGFVADLSGSLRYRLRISQGGFTLESEDPYAFPPLLTDYDLYLLGEGAHYQSYERLGAHLREMDGVKGTHFAVWAPNAGVVSLIGEFNQWDARVHPMRFHAGAGVWDIFMPGVCEGSSYKYQVWNRDFSAKADKSDPYGFYAELRPGTASIIYSIDGYEWHDAEWVADRKRRHATDAPIAIYEVHLGSWKRAPGTNRWLTYRESAVELVEYVKRMGYTHIELMPVAEHPYDGSWGYQTVGYYAPTSRFGTPSDFMVFVDTCHQNGIGVFMDWVPAHFPKDGHGLAFFDGTHLYEHPDTRLGEHPDWGTLVFNYGRFEVRNFLLSNALFWLKKYHIDGLRVDAVASMLYLDYSRKPGEWAPNRYGGRENLDAIDLLKKLNELTHGELPGIVTIAEESTAWPMVTRPTHIGGLGFDLKWNMGWMHDMLKYMAMDPLFRRNNQNLITFSLMYAFSEQFVLALSHDEVVHLKKSLLDKMPGDEWKKFATLRAFYGYMVTHPGKKLLFMGGEFGQWREWSEVRSLDWDLLDRPLHRQLQTTVAELNRLYQAEPALHELDFTWDGFAWIDLQDIDQSVISFLRRGHAADEIIVVACNFTPVPRHGYRIGVPQKGTYREIFNSDDSRFGGSGVTNGVSIRSEMTAWQSQSFSVVVSLPPLATIMLKCVVDEETSNRADALAT